MERVNDIQFHSRKLVNRKTAYLSKKVVLGYIIESAGTWESAKTFFLNCWFTGFLGHFII